MNARSVLPAATALALLLVTASAVRYANRAPVPLPATAPATEFSAERALRHVRFMARTPRPAGSGAHAMVRMYLIAELTQLGLTPHVQDVTAIGTRFAVSGRVRNVLARMPGTDSGGKAVVLVAHYDGVPAGPAAGDDASGAAAILETMRALRAGPRLRNDVIVLITDGEENGLLGAAPFVREHPWARDVGVILNFEARGTGGPSYMFQTGEGNLDAVRVLRSAPYASATSLSTTVYRRLPNDTDLSELALLETPALNFAFIHGVARYHTSEDDVAHLDQSSVQHIGEQALALARRFGNETLPRRTTSDAVFARLPIVGLVIYPEKGSLIVIIIAIGLVVGTVVRTTAKEPRWIRGTIIGAAATLAAVVLSGAVALGLAQALAAVHGSMPLGGDPAWSTLYATAITVLVVAMAAGSHALARRWSSASAAHAGALAIWLLLSLVVTLVAPGPSFLFAWPLLAVAGAALAKSFSTRPRVTAAFDWSSTIVALFVVVPITYLTVSVALGLDAIGATILAVLASLTTWLLAPHLETMRGARPAVAPMVAAVVGLVLLGIGLLTVRTDGGHPVGVSLAYAVDADSGKAWLTGTGGTASARTWLGQSLRQATTGTPDHGHPRWLTRSFDPNRTIPAPLAARVSAPTVNVVRDLTVNDTRLVSLRVVPGPGTQVIYLAPSGPVLSWSVDGKPVTTDRYRNPDRPWPLQYIAPSDSGFTLALMLRPGSAVMFGIMSRVESIPQLEGLRLPSRPPGVLPYQAGDVTLVYRRVALD